MAILRASNVNHRGATLPQFCHTSTAVFVEHSAGCCAILLKKNADWKLQDIWRKAARRQTEIYRKIEEEQNNVQQKSTEKMKKKSTTVNRNLQKRWRRTARRQKKNICLQSKDICVMMTSPDWAATNSRRNGHARQTDSKRLTGDIKEERPSVTGKPPLYITLNCDCPILINKTIYGKTKSCKSKLKRQ